MESENQGNVKGHLDNVHKVYVEQTNLKTGCSFLNNTFRITLLKLILDIKSCTPFLNYNYIVP